MVAASRKNPDANRSGAWQALRDEAEAEFKRFVEDLKRVKDRVAALLE
ncbi:MAG TPA: hypothetical protein VK533_15355 [Sphingomonas sp.]|nr:hypothetical protein [Sphingomonas sp.]HMI20911.1 hypothetical protein [Sphingomonas sp.]